MQAAEMPLWVCSPYYYLGLLRFPAGVHDDCVDTMAWIGQMLSLLVRPREVKPPPKKSWKDKLRRLAGNAERTRDHLAS